jgi:metallopeptidase MepB
LVPGFIKKDGKSRHYPATALVCNLSKPTSTKPSLLKYDEVNTLFHELGHGMHRLCGRNKYSRFQGTSTVRDFVEAPSQMLENWVYQPSVLKRLTSHYQTGESMPEELAAKLIDSRHVDEGLYYLRQLNYGMFDMAIHTPATHDDAKKMDVGVVYNNLMHEVTGLKGPEDLGMGE